jgi:catechol 2,3-dioxygenase-like lactoylglutathione lyase family enzyme
MRKLQSQGVHHITLVGADRQTSIDFWEGVLGMPFVFEQPNLDQPAESHLYFDPGDGRLITVFTDEARRPDPARTSTDIGAVHHIAFAVSRATFQQAVARLDERRIRHSGVKDRGFMDSILLDADCALGAARSMNPRSALEGSRKMGRANQRHMAQVGHGHH